MKESTFVISSMCCPAEEALARKGLERVPGVKDLAFDLMERKVKVRHEADDAKLLAALKDVGMDASPAPLDVPAGEEESEPGVSRRTWILMGVSGTAAMGSEILAWTGSSESSPAVIVLALLAIATGGLDTLRAGWTAVRNFTININFLMSVAVLGAIAIGQWPEAAVVIFLFAVAELIEKLSFQRAKNAIRGLMAMTPETVSLRSSGDSWRDVPAAEATIDQVFRVKPGERIALDGVVTAGSSSVNQAPITGESIPVSKEAGDRVFAGTVNERGMLEIKITANKGNTTLARIIKSVQEAQGQRAPTQRFVDQFARYYTPAVFVFAALTAVVPSLFFGAAFQPWLYKALVLLVIACPCALVISTPVTVVSGLASAARRGILIKGGARLENGCKLKAIALDKTGTLTYGKPVLTDVVPLVDQPKESLLQLAASIEVNSEHPVASALVSAWSASDKSGKGGRPLLATSRFDSLTGRGAQAAVDGHLYYVGSPVLVKELGISTPKVEQALAALEQEGKTAVVLSSRKEALCIFGVADTVRETSREAVAALKSMGIEPIMLSGDNETTARSIAAKVGISQVHAGLLPEAKLAMVSELLKQYGQVGMVGDGINDAPALANASIGFAMGAAGTDTAIETADVALMDDDLRKLGQFIDLSRQTSRVLIQNITLALGIKVVFFALALSGHATLWMAVFADLGASLLVVFNGLRLLRYRSTSVAASS